MKLLELSEILNLVEYEKVRAARRREIVALKQARRVSVGRYLTFVFENRATVWFQIQEMVRAERIVDESKIAAGPALRKIGELLRMIEEPPERGGRDEGPVPRL